MGIAWRLLRRVGPNISDVSFVVRGGSEQTSAPKIVFGAFGTVPAALVAA
jgi:hypothetical protein